MDTLTIRTKFKDLIAQQTYNKKWSELPIPQQDELRSKHKQQFDTLSRRARKEMGNDFTREDRDLLIRVDERSERVEKWCYNHDEHHAKYTYFALTTTIGAIITLAIIIIKLV